jgi:hypothetical protein
MIHGKLSGASGGDKTASLPSWRQTTRDATREVWRSEPIRIKLVLLDPVFEDSDEAVGSCCVLRLDNGSPLVTASAVESCTSAKVKRESLPSDGLLCDTDPNPGFQPLLGGKHDRNEIRAYGSEFLPISFLRAFTAR